MNFRVVDDAGHELASGRDLAALKAQLGQAAQLTFGRAEPGIEREGITAWDFGDLPAEIAFTRAGRRLTGYPALVDEGGSVAVRLFDTRAAADASMRGGVCRLLRIALKDHLRQLDKTLAGLTQAALQLRNVASAEDLREDVLAAIADRAFIGEDELPRSARDFEQQKARARARLPAVAEGAVRLVAAIAHEYHRVSQKLAAGGPTLNRVSNDIRAQLARLVCKGFVSATPWESLAHVPRYLQAMLRRLEKYPENPERDGKHAAAIAELWKLYEARAEKVKRAGERDPRLEDFRWAIEELRVSLFAQELRTPYPVSVKRLMKLWHSIAG
jgi:ATP-dependent helicase HrpA